MGPEWVQKGVFWSTLDPPTIANLQGPRLAIVGGPCPDQNDDAISVPDRCGKMMPLANVAGGKRLPAFGKCDTTQHADDGPVRQSHCVGNQPYWAVAERSDDGYALLGDGLTRWHDIKNESKVEKTHIS